MDGKGQGMIPVVIEELAMMGGKKRNYFDWTREGGRERGELCYSDGKEGIAYPFTQSKNQGNGKELRMAISLRREPVSGE